MVSVIQYPLYYWNPDDPICDPATGLPTDEYLLFMNAAVDRGGGQGQDKLSGMKPNGKLQTYAMPSALAAIGAYYSNITTALVTAADAGSDVTFTIETHDRTAGGVTVEVQGATLTGAGYSTEYYLYYDDENFAGGAVTWGYTTNGIEAREGNDRVCIGTVTTPAPAGAPVTRGTADFDGGTAGDGLPP